MLARIAFVLMGNNVQETLTEELLDELLASPKFDDFEEGRGLRSPSLSEYLTVLLKKHGFSRATVVREAGMNETFGWQVFKGERGCGRDKTLALAFALHTTLREANRLLQAAGHNALYCKNRRDAIIIFCLDKGYTLAQADQALYDFGEQTISASS